MMVASTRMLRVRWLARILPLVAILCLFSCVNGLERPGRKLRTPPRSRSRSSGVDTVLMGRKRVAGGGAKPPTTAAASSKPPAAAGPAGRQPAVRYAILAALLYNLSIAWTVPVLPKICNVLINNGDAKVSPESASFYGLVSGIDQLVTFNIVNGACSLSDRYGRKPFMGLSNFGLGSGQLLTLTALTTKNPHLLLMGAFIDGCTSISYPVNQAYIADVVTDPRKLTEAYGAFQGLATGLAFMLGIPASGIVAAKFGLNVPLMVAAGICVLNVLYISLLVPESLPPSRRKEEHRLQDANAFGALKMVSRNPFMALIAFTYFLLHLSLNALQVSFINYTQHRFSWGIAQASSALCMMFAFVAVLPKLILPALGVQRSITVCSLVYAAAFFLLASTTVSGLVYAALTLLAVGSTALPATLALLTNQVDEKGAANGAADTCRTLASMLGFPLGSQVFALGLRRGVPGLVFFAGSAVVLMAYVSLQSAVAFHAHHDRSA